MVLKYPLQSNPYGMISRIKRTNGVLVNEFNFLEYKLLKV